VFNYYVVSDIVKFCTVSPFEKTGFYYFIFLFSAVALWDGLECSGIVNITANNITML